MFNYNHLYYFYITAKHGGVMNASKVLRVAQPSLTSQIKNLEGELELSLFHKVGRRLALTPDGERAYGFCRKIFEAAEEFSDYLKHSELTSKTHRCKIGVTREIERPFIADVLSSLIRDKAAHEQPLLSTVSNDHTVLMDRLRFGEIDAVVTNQDSNDSDLRRVAELSMPVFAVANPSLVRKLALSKTESIGKALKNRDVGLILPSDQIKFRVETDFFLQKSKIRNPVVLETDILAVIVRAACEGVGVAFLPKHYIFKELKQDVLVQLGDKASLWSHTIFLLARVSKQPEPIIEQMGEHFIRLGGKSGNR